MVSEMAKIEITLTFDGEKMDALEYALRKERTTVKKQMDEALRQLYETKVPEAVRDYLNRKAVPQRPRRVSSPAKPPEKTEPSPVKTYQEMEGMQDATH